MAAKRPSEKPVEVPVKARVSSPDSGECPRCDVQNKLRTRVFSAQAQAALVTWGEMDQSDLEKALCDDCYDELRDILIDRASDLEAPGAPVRPKHEAPVASPAAKTASVKAPPPPNKQAPAKNAGKSKTGGKTGRSRAS
jgi:hypothetical protein